VVVGDVIDEAAAQPARSVTHDRQHDQGLGVEDVRLGRRLYDHISPRSRAPSVGDHLEGAPQRMQQAVEAHRSIWRQHLGIRVQAHEAADGVAETARQGTQRVADAAVDVESGQLHAGRQLLFSWQARC